MFSFRNGMIWDLRYKSVILFEFTFVYGVRLIVQFDSFACSCPGFPIPFIEKTLSSQLYILALS